VTAEFSTTRSDASLGLFATAELLVKLTLLTLTVYEISLPVPLKIVNNRLYIS